MNGIVDKAAVLVCCLAPLVSEGPGEGAPVALLCAVAASAAAELAGQRAFLPAAAYALLSVPFAPLGAFVALPLYDLARSAKAAPFAIGVACALVCAVRLEPSEAAFSALASALSCLLARRSRQASREAEAGRARRDEARERSLAVEAKCAGLIERQDLEVRLATLSERSRIAREIHDNVGHLLTRAVLQVKALQVTHRENAPIAEDLEAVARTLDEALGSVRESVHNLHDEGFDLETQLRACAAACPVPAELDYRAEHVPAQVGYSFLAIAREALSNAARHSDATRVRVAVAEHPGFFRLTVRDNGTAAPQGGAPAAEGIGLSTMRDRTESLGGVFRTAFDRGFTVTATVPKARRTGGAQPGSEVAAGVGASANAAREAKAVANPAHAAREDAGFAEGPGAREKAAPGEKTDAEADPTQTAGRRPHE